MIRILHGDSRELLKTLPDNSVDSIVTDPPYGLAFMGKSWDYDIPAVEIWQECLRVLKPGGHLLAFAGTRTQHRMCSRIEDAGFEIRDMIAWVYGSGFPKSHNGAWGGTALKPALEPITMARKPMAGTVAANYGAHGTGALNIDGCRVLTDDNLSGGSYSESGNRSVSSAMNPSGMNVAGKTVDAEFVQPLGRWPANLIHDGSDEVLAAFPKAPGALMPVIGTEPSGKTAAVFGDFGGRSPSDKRDGGGSSSRFFYCAKADRTDRNDGLYDVSRKSGIRSNGPRSSEEEKTPNRQNNHPTVKPTDLMRYLCRLVTPAGGTVLDPFMGSGSTLKAAELEGFSAIGIELDADYIEIARRRIASDAPLFAEVEI